MWFLQNQTVSYGIETITYLGPKIWSIIPGEIRESASLETFRQKISYGNQIVVHVAFAKKYIANVGFVNIS